MQISPSILSADFANLQHELDRIAAADWAHVDVMDAHFVPNLTIGLPVVERLAQVSPVPLDCHLMIDDPDRWAPQYAEAAAELEPQVRLAKVDTDAQPGLASEFNIRSIPTMALFKAGREVARQSGAMNKSDIVRWVRAHA